MKERYKMRKFRQESLDLIATCNEVIERYAADGLKLTLRQLYYQLVTQNIIPNEERSYKNIGSLVSDGRLAGLIDWDAIEDRGRRPRGPSDWPDVRQFVDAAARAFRLPRWEGQRFYAELWVEKDALAGVLEPLANEFHVTLCVNKGYSSQSALYEAAKRFKQEYGHDLVLFYLGDHDPSGEDMVRDIGARLAMFGVPDLDVQKLALTMEQIDQYNPPPNPAKMSDSRARAYVERHGHSSWEVDALPPNVLQGIIRQAFNAIIDDLLMGEIVAREEVDRKKLRSAAKRIAAE